MARPVRAARHARGRGRQDQQGRERGARQPRHSGVFRLAWLQAGRQRRGRVQGLHRGREQEVGRHREDGRREAGLTAD